MRHGIDGVALPLKGIAVIIELLCALSRYKGLREHFMSQFA
jgi:hypothetical protein